MNHIRLCELPFSPLDLELGANETGPKTSAAVEGNFLFPAELGRETQAQELLAATLRPQGNNLPTMQPEIRDTELKNGEGTGFWSHNLSNWIKPPLKPILFLSYMNQNILTV